MSHNIQLHHALVFELSLCSRKFDEGIRFAFLQRIFEKYETAFSSFKRKAAWNGARIFQYTHSSLLDARAQNFDVSGPSALETAHFSIASNSETVNIYVHWRSESTPGEPEFHRAILMQGYVDNHMDVEHAREIIKHVYKSAVK